MSLSVVKSTPPHVLFQCETGSAAHAIPWVDAYAGLCSAARGGGLAVGVPGGVPYGDAATIRAPVVCGLSGGATAGIWYSGTFRSSQ